MSTIMLTVQEIEEVTECRHRRQQIRDIIRRHTLRTAGHLMTCDLGNKTCVEAEHYDAQTNHAG